MLKLDLGEVVSALFSGRLPVSKFVPASSNGVVQDSIVLLRSIDRSPETKEYVIEVVHNRESLTDSLSIEIPVRRNGDVCYDAIITIEFPSRFISYRTLLKYYPDCVIYLIK